MINTILIFAFGFIAGAIMIPVIKHLNNRPKKAVKQDVIKPENMEEVSDFDEKDFTNVYFEKAMHAIQSEDDWRVKVDNSEIEFYKSLKDEDGRTQYVKITARYDFDKENNRKFNIRSSINVEGGNGSYGNDYRIYGDPTPEIKTFLYKNYISWKNEVNEKKKAEVSKKLESFKGILGKAVDRDMKLDQLLGNKED